MNPAQATLLFAVALLAGLPFSLADLMPSIDGIWLSGDGDGWVEISATTAGLSGVITGSPNTKVRGYIGVPILGRTETWTRKTD